MPDLPEEAVQAAVEALQAVDDAPDAYPTLADFQRVVAKVALEAAAPILAERAHANSHVASKSATPVEIIALSGCSRPEDGRPCKICVGRAEKHVRAVEAGGLAVVSAEERRELLALLRELADPDPCEFDHGGDCQAHGPTSTWNGCPHARALELLAALPERTPS
ncbi:hypothetical protein [Nonomuraea guangzhouensis]|uniref:DUF222 domain-containing protein n=1 Tax=Nonomuraea guangzhouensis TaxID=1291555 RepID=A0ABW4GX70_9ACTN|nr:hypothetical protein [Nonomuraea guangzhouensis]